ncbi:DNA topoisomerase 2-binding protein 1 [Geranomyces michiganensis]|nr:DNA topoisomerase 2-binding protein 1 [Geranomyces michiganensis]
MKALASSSLPSTSSSSTSSSRQQQQQRQQRQQPLAALREKPCGESPTLKPIFAKVYISVTGFSEQRAELHKLVGDRGGRFSGALTRECTHLITEEPSGPKYEFAVGSKRIHIVSREWVIDSVRANQLLDEAQYKVNPKTTMKGSDANKDSAPGSVRARAAPKLGNACLKGCSIFLGDGFGDAQIKHIHKVVRACGGSLPSTFDEFVTHVVVSGKTLSDADHRLMRGGMRAVPVVSHTWLRDCYKNHALMPLQPYLMEQTEGWYRGRQESGGDDAGRRAQTRSAPRESHAAFRVDDFQSGIDEPPTKPPSPSRVQHAGAAPSDKEFTFVTFGKQPPSAGNGPVRPPEPDWANGISPVVTSRSRDEKSLAESSKRDSAVGLRRTLTAEISAADSTFANSTYAHIEPTMTVAQTMYSEIDPLMPPRPLRRIFAGMTMACTGFDFAEQEAMRIEVERLGGKWSDTHSLPHAGGERWLIAPLVSTTRHMPYGVQVVTNCWLNRCIDDNELYNPSNVIVFRPLETSMPIAGFETLVIGVSGYQDSEREHLGHLARLMGAKFTEIFTKRNTHLLCKPGTDNAKPRKSKEWGIPVASAQWLYACASQGRLLDTGGYDISSPARANATMDVATAAQLSRAQTPGTTAHTVPRTVQARFDTSAALTSLETPVPPPRHAPAANQSVPTSHGGASTPGSPLSPMSFTKRLGKAVQHARRRVRSEADHELDIDEMPEAAPIPSRPGSPSRSVSPNVHSVADSNLLRGIVLCFSLKIGQRRNDLFQIARQLGAQVSSTYSDGCTHFVYQSSRQNDQMKEYKTARAAGKYIVSPEWLVQCLETGTRLKEGDYPHFFNPNRALAISNPASQTAGKKVETPKLRSSPSKQKTVIPRELPAAVASPLASEVRPNGAEHVHRTTSNTSTRSDAPPANYDVMIDTLMDAKTIRRRSRPSFPPPVPDTSRGSETAGDIDSGPTTVNSVSSMLAEAAGTLPPPSAQGNQSEVRRNLRDEAAAIVYDDPEARIAKRKLMEQLEDPQAKKAKTDAVGSPSAVLGGTHTVTPPPPRFVLSGLARAERSALAQMIQALGGTVHDGNWNASVTHLVVARLGRTEKCLAAIASGVWLVRPDYVRACGDAGAFVDEEPWEWTLDGAAELGEDDQWMHKAPRRWRRQLGNCRRSGEALDSVKPLASSSRRGAFEGWQVLIAVNGSRRDGFHRLLSAGCATVHLDPLAFAQLPRTPTTFVMTDQNADSLRTIPALYDLAVKGTPFINSNYCGQFLFNEGTAPSWNEWIVNVLDTEPAPHP